MKTLNFILLSVCLVIYGCDSPVKMSPYEVILRETKKIIDEHDWDFKYAKIFRYCSNDVGDIYMLSFGNSPLQMGNWMPPSNVMPYKEHYICYIDTYSKHILSKKELNAELKDNSWENDWDSDSDSVYIVGVSKDGKSCSIIRPIENIPTSLRPYIYPLLRKYHFSSSNANPLLILGDYAISVDQRYRLGYSLRNHINELWRCEIFVSEACDSFFIQNIQNPQKVRFVTLNGKDTLKYTIYGFLYNHLFLKTSEYPSFFKRLPAIRTEYYLDSLIRNNTYCIIERDGEEENIPVAYFDGGYEHDITNDSRVITTIVKKELNEWIRDIDSSLKWNNAEVGN